MKARWKGQLRDGLSIQSCPVRDAALQGRAFPTAIWRFYELKEEGTRDYDLAISAASGKRLCEDNLETGWCRSWDLPSLSISHISHGSNELGGQGKGAASIRAVVYLICYNYWTAILTFDSRRSQNRDIAIACLVKRRAMTP